MWSNQFALCGATLASARHNRGAETSSDAGLGASFAAACAQTAQIRKSVERLGRERLARLAALHIGLPGCSKKDDDEDDDGDDAECAKNFSKNLVQRRFSRALFRSLVKLRQVFANLVKQMGDHRAMNRTVNRRSFSVARAGWGIGEIPCEE